MRFLLPLIILELISLELFSASSGAASQTLTMNPEKRLKVVISCDSMNRIAVINDRITQIFGDNEAYEVQTEESTGQLFLKPTSENGKKPLSVTLITENGVTQDMVLQPEEREATTVILKNDGVVAGAGNETLIDATGGLGAFPSFHAAAVAGQGVAGQNAVGQGARQRVQGVQGDFSHNTAYGMQSPGLGAAHTFQDQIIVAMKYLVSGAAPVLDIDGVNRKSLKGLEVNFVQAFNLGAFKGLKLNVQNTTEVAMDVLEKDFLHTLDLALSFEKRILQAGESTTLYVVVR